MTPFAAWLAMGLHGLPAKFSMSMPGSRFGLFTHQSSANAASDDAQPLPVLIVPDTKENRRKLGMEE